MNLKWRTVLIGLAVVLFGSIAGFRIFSRLATKNANTSPDQQALVIRVEKVSKGEVVDQVKISGTIRPVNEVEIYPKIPGRIIALNFNVGDKVHAGDVLAIIEHQEILLQQKSARASLAMAKTNEAAAKTYLNRARELFQERAMAKAELEAIEQKYDIAAAQALAAEAEADIAGQQLRNASITSLINGTITRRVVALGANVSPSMPVFTVQDLSKLKLLTSVDAHTLVRLKKGSWALLTVDELQLKISGKVISLAPSLDSQSRRAEVEIEIDDKSGKLVPNMFIDGSLVLSKINSALIVPNRALITANARPSIFRVVDGKIQVVSPELGQRDTINSQILDGLAEGDVIAVSGLDRLREGSAVTIEETAK